MKHKKRKSLFGLITILILLVAARAYLPIFLKNYVNDSLAQLENYDSSVSDIDVSLWRGAYQLIGFYLHEKKAKRDIITTNTIDISLQWSALFKGRIVSSIDIDKLELLIPYDQSENAESVEKADKENWYEPLRDIVPISINRLSLSNSRFTMGNKKNSYIDYHHIEGHIENLRNINHKDDDFPSPFDLHAETKGKGEITLDGRVHVLKEIPNLIADLKLTNENLTSYNPIFQDLAYIDFNKGELNLYTQLKIHHQKISGYVKPMLSNMDLVDVSKEGDIFALAWEAVSALFLHGLQNQSTGQFATVVPLEGQIEGPEVDVWDAVFNIFENAFVDAYHQGFEKKKLYTKK